jgi:Mg-chelatase subunit ChlI
VLVILGTNKQPSKQNSPTRTAETCTTCCLCYTGQTDGLRRSDRWTEPVRSVAAAAAQQVFQRASMTSLGPVTKTPPKTHPAKKNSSQTQAKHLQNTQELTSKNTTQRHTDSATHSRNIPQRAPTSQNGQEHRSDRCNLGSSG